MHMGHPYIILFLLLHSCPQPNARQWQCLVMLNYPVWYYLYLLLSTGDQDELSSSPWSPGDHLRGSRWTNPTLQWWLDYDHNDGEAMFMILLFFPAGGGHVLVWRRGARGPSPPALPGHPSRLPHTSATATKARRRRHNTQRKLLRGHLAEAY